MGIRKRIYTKRMARHILGYVINRRPPPYCVLIPVDMPLIMDAAAQYQACSIENWYEDFQEVSIRTNIVKIPQEVLAYLRDDRMVLPTECYALENDEWEDEGENDEAIEYSFPAFSDVVQKNLRLFRKRSPGCFVKANWHAPIDAKWINTGQSLCVSRLDEFYQVMKASDIIKEDLSRLGDDTEYVIAFREYMSHIHPGSEFRCYVKRNELVGITSRWWPEFFPHFLSERSQILLEIQRFYLDHIHNKFSLENYTFDVIRNSDRSSASQSRVLLVDFAPLLKETFKKLAFEWEELDCDVVEFETPEFRYLEQSIHHHQQDHDDDNDDDNPPEDNQFADIQPNFDNYKFGFPIDFQENSLSDLIPGLRDFLSKN